MDLLKSLADAGRVIMMILGLSTPYPNVDIRNIDIYTRSNSVLVEFRAFGLVNEPLRDILESGIGFNIIYSITTTADGRQVFKDEICRTLCFSNSSYFMNASRLGGGFGNLTNSLSSNRMTVLPGAKDYTNRTIRTSIEILINAEGYPDMSKLWGNQPELRLEYRL
jgi:hypothetical protein